MFVDLLIIRFTECLEFISWLWKFQVFYHRANHM